MVRSGPCTDRAWDELPAMKPSSCQQGLRSSDAHPLLGAELYLVFRRLPPSAKPSYRLAMGAALRIVIGTTLRCVLTSAAPSQQQLVVAGLALQGGDLIRHAGNRRRSHAMHRAPRSDPSS